LLANACLRSFAFAQDFGGGLPLRSRPLAPQHQLENF